MANNRRQLGGMLMAVAVLFALTVNAGPVATKKSDVLNSKHNLSATTTYQAYAPARTWVASTETQICVFCHTPHGATTGPYPLWNRRLSSAAYTGYSTTSLDAKNIQAGFTGQPGGSSKLCLSCHDGTMAANNVNVINGAANWTTGVNIPMSASVTSPYTFANNAGLGATTGFTADIGTDLRNDHPISVDYTAALVTRDGELRGVNAATQRDTATGTLIGPLSSGYHPTLPLEGAVPNAQIQCATCHDPHIVDTASPTKGEQMFLRLNRFQEVNNPTGPYNSASDILCLGCHDKNTNASFAWGFSSHANSAAASQTYVAGAATPRQFLSGLPVWKAGCLSCHNGHTVAGATRLLTEGTNGALTAVLPGGIRQGGTSAQENTCFQCHTSAANTIIASTTGPLIDIQGLMSGSTTRHPVVATEVHDIGGAGNQDGANGIESQTLLGLAALGNRHAECPDCHNPHRIAKVQRIDSSTIYTAGGVHRHEDATGYVHDNIASGVLRGTWGVEPVFSNNSFHSMPSSFTVKKGVGNTTSVTDAFVTREYQVCLKCHSNYAYSDDNVYPTSSNRPQLGGAGLTVANSNSRTSFSSYTNQAKEFQAPVGHRGGSGAGDAPTTMNSGNNGGAGMPTTTAATARCTTANASLCNNNNHRSWHPVFGPTGRVSYGAYMAPWNNAGARGAQTMYCSDCHGSASTTNANSVIPANRSATGVHVAGSTDWGPHGGTTTNNTQVFMLKGVWNASALSTTANLLCFKCHCRNAYGGGTNPAGCTNGTAGVSGFAGSETHTSRSNHRANCQYCHVAIVHGWKNKSFLVNLDDIGPEAGSSVTTSAPTAARYTKGPYYGNAGLRIKRFGTSGNWSQNDCSQYTNSH